MNKSTRDSFIGVVALCFSTLASGGCFQAGADAYTLKSFPERKIELLKKEQVQRTRTYSFSNNGHWSDEGISTTKTARDYLLASWARVEKALKSNVMFGRELNLKEIESLKHQKDLIDAIVSNPERIKKLNALGFNFESYIRGTLDSDMGKLSVYQDLFLTESAKSKSFLNFLQGKSSRKVNQAVKEVLKEIGFPSSSLHFINPKLTHAQVRETFDKARPLLGYYHEFPGMADAVAAFKRGALNKAEFQSQLRTNLFHNGPDEGFWKVFGHVIVPDSEADGMVAKIFKDTIFFNQSAPSSAVYGAPSSFESFIGTIFDRMSQGTRGGYSKIDLELEFMDPLGNVRNLVLEESISWTLSQFKLLKEQVKSAKFLSEQQRLFINEMIDNGSSRISLYRDNMEHIISMPRDVDGNVLKPVMEMTLLGKAREGGHRHLAFKLIESGDAKYYQVTDLDTGWKKDMNFNEARSLLRSELEIAMKNEEALFGDPMRDNLTSMQLFDNLGRR